MTTKLTNDLSRAASLISANGLSTDLIQGYSFLLGKHSLNIDISQYIHIINKYIYIYTYIYIYIYI